MADEHKQQAAEHERRATDAYERLTERVASAQIDSRAVVRLEREYHFYLRLAQLHATLQLADEVSLLYASINER